MRPHISDEEEKISDKDIFHPISNTAQHRRTFGMTWEKWDILLQRQKAKGSILVQDMCAAEAAGANSVWVPELTSTYFPLSLQL